MTCYEAMNVFNTLQNIKTLDKECNIYRALNIIELIGKNYKWHPKPIYYHEFYQPIKVYKIFQIMVLKLCGQRCQRRYQ